MENFVTENKLVEIVNKAIQLRNENDISNFNLTLKEIDELHYHRKFDLIEFLFPNYSDDKMRWVDKFIINDIKLSDNVVESLNLFISLLNIGKNYEIIFYQNLITSILQKINIETDEIYYTREFILKHTEFKSIECIPLCFKLKENQILPELQIINIGEPEYQFIQNEKGEIYIEYHVMFGNVSEAEIEIGKEFENERINNNLKLITVEDNLIYDYQNSKNLFM